ncbi:MAG: hypothetical protein QXF12_03520 [Candidatus Aenigmatarchaeota archaeon]
MKQSNKVYRTVRSYNVKSYSLEQLDEDFLKEADKILFSKNKNILRSYSIYNVMEDIKEIVFDLSTDDVISNKDSMIFLNLLEKHYGFSNFKLYNDNDDSLDSTLASINITMGTLYLTLTFLAFSRIKFESSIETVLAVLGLTLFGLFGGVLPITLGTKHIYNVIKRMLKRPNSKLNKLYNLAIKLTNRLKRTNKIKNKVEIFKQVIEENADQVQEITNEIQKELEQ